MNEKERKRAPGERQADTMKIKTS